MKKSLWSKLAVFAFVCFLPLQIASAGVSISGKQTAGSAGSNAKLTCSPVKISKTMKITGVSGSNAGFWIQKGSATVARYYKSNDPSAKGRSLDPGTYYVYPNLPNGAKTATVTVSLN